MANQRVRAIAAWVVAGALAATGPTGCSRRPVRGSLDRPALGAMAGVDGVDFAPYLALAHAIVGHQPRPTLLPPPGPADRVFVTAWTPGKPARRATGLGGTLVASVVAASEELAKASDAGELRVEIDTLVAASPATLDGATRVQVFDVGLDGYIASDGGGKIGWVLPGEVIFERDVDLTRVDEQRVRLRPEKIMEAMASRAQADVRALDRWNVASFRVDSRVEPALAGGPPLALFRTMPPHPTELSADGLLAAVRAGGDYLARMIDDTGAFTYLYDPVHDEEKLEDGYSMLRHAGAVYALMEAYEELRVPEWQRKAALALMYLSGHLKPTPYGLALFDNDDEEQQKAGGSGLALIAMVEYARATGDWSALGTMRGIARFVLHQQYEDGHFRANVDVPRGESGVAKERPTEVPFYAGEATLGLVRLYALDADAALLAAARKGADYLVRVQGSDSKEQIPDHWLSYALRDLYAVTKEAAYSAHAKRIARAISLGEPKGEALPYPDYVGSFFQRGESTPSAIRLEALASSLELERATGANEEELPTAMRLACFLRGQQIDGDSAYFARAPGRALGGVREGLLGSDVRIDYTQHAMSGWLRLARLLRDPERGKRDE